MRRPIPHGRGSPSGEAADDPRPAGNAGVGAGCQSRRGFSIVPHRPRHRPARMAAELQADPEKGTGLANPRTTCPPSRRRTAHRRRLGGAGPGPVRPQCRPGRGGARIPAAGRAVRLPAVRRRQGGGRHRGQEDRRDLERRRRAVREVHAQPAGASGPLGRPARLRLREHRRRDLLLQPARPKAALAPAVRLSPPRDAARLAAPARHPARPPAADAAARPARPARLPDRGHRGARKIARRGPAPRADPARHRRRQDLHRLLVLLAADPRSGCQTHPVSGGPQQPRRPDAEGVPELPPARRRQPLHRHLHRPAPARPAHRPGRQGGHHHHPVPLFPAARQGTGRGGRGTLRL